MQRFEFKVIPAPKRGEKARGIKSTEDRFAYALTHLMNELGAEGWDYVRADALPCEERVGFTGSKTSYFNMLVFRRPLAGSDETRPAVWLNRHDPAETAPPRLGPAETPLPSTAPAIGPAIGPGNGSAAPEADAGQVAQPAASKA